MQLFANNAESTLAASINASVTTMVLGTGDGAKFPNPTGGDFFLVTVLQKVGATEANWEIVKCTARSGDTLTIQRGQDSTTAQVHAFGDVVSLRATASSMATESRALNAILTGFSIASAAAATAADTILSALGKLQAQINGKQATLVSASNIKTVNGASLLGAADILTTDVAHVDKGTVSTGTVTFDYAAAGSQRLQVGGGLTIALTNIPASGRRFTLLLELVNAGSAAVTFPTINWVKPDGTITTTLSAYLTAISRPALQSAGTDFVLLWGRDGGTTIYGKLL